MDLEARVQHYTLCSSEVASEVLAARQSNQFLPQSARALLPKATLASRLVVWPHHSALRAACFCRGHLVPTGQPLLDCSPLFSSNLSACSPRFCPLLRCRRFICQARCPSCSRGQVGIELPAIDHFVRSFPPVCREFREQFTNDRQAKGTIVACLKWLLNVGIMACMR